MAAEDLLSPASSVDRPQRDAQRLSPEARCDSACHVELRLGGGFWETAPKQTQIRTWHRARQSSPAHSRNTEILILHYSSHLSSLTRITPSAAEA